MEQYTVTGMSCAACSAHVEKAVSKVEGVTSCTVNLLTNSLAVEGTAPDEAVIEAVRQAGYGSSPEQARQAFCRASSACPCQGISGSRTMDLTWPSSRRGRR